MSRPFRADAAQKPYRPGFLRRCLAYVANGDLPPVLAFVWPAREPWIPPPPPVKRRPAAKLIGLATNGSVPFVTVLERSEHVAEWIKLMEEKADVSRHVAAKSPGRPEGGRKAAAREIGVDEKAARRAEKVAGLSDEAKEIYEALHPETRQHSAGGHAKAGSASDNLSFAEDTALRASIAACCIIFAACAGWAVTL